MNDSSDTGNSVSTEEQLWYKNSVIYGLDIKTFIDSNGDGIGDFRGAIGGLSYLQSLGVNCVWLLPFYLSPFKDNGYDIVDYKKVHPDLGTIEDFKEFVEEARKRGIRVLIDLVANHTSDEHPWFLESKKDKNSQYRDYYIWTETPPKENAGGDAAFPGEDEELLWSYDDEAKAYYYHKFYKFQPDLNFNNSQVRKEVFSIMDFWLALGIFGFRMDAAGIMFRAKGLPGTEVKDAAEFLESMYQFIKSKNRDAILFSEADVSKKEMSLYVGQGNRITALLNFLLVGGLFVGLAERKNSCIIAQLQDNRELNFPKESTFVNFYRNMDELNLVWLDKEQTNLTFKEFAPREEMQIYGRGIRRRLLPMLYGDIKRYKMAMAMLFSLPGTPMFVYGDEIGMGDNLEEAGRISVRTPMQWSDLENAGFSTAPPDKVIRKPVSEGVFNYRQVNVVAQEDDPNSILNFMRNIIALRQRCTEIGFGEWNLLEVPENVLAIKYVFGKKRFMALSNLSEQGSEFSVKDLESGNWTEILSDSGYRERADKIELKGYGYRWFRDSD